MKGQGTWNHELWQGGEGKKKKGRAGEGGTERGAPNFKRLRAIIVWVRRAKRIQAFFCIAKASSQPCTNRNLGSPCPHAKLAV